jgi:hypothetical protein
MTDRIEVYVHSTFRKNTGLRSTELTYCIVLIHIIYKICHRLQIHKHPLPSQHQL